MKDKINKLKKKVKTKFNDFKSNPKLEVNKFITRSKEIIKHNMLFFIYVFTLLVNTIFLRYFTIHTLQNIVFYKPLFSDLVIILIVGSFSYLLKEKHRFPYLLITSILLTLICIINSIYYTFYTSFTSISLVLLTQYAKDVGDAIVDKVMKWQDFIYLWAPISLIITYIKLKRDGKISKRGNANKRKFYKCLSYTILPLAIVLLTLTSRELGRLSKQWNREYIVEHFGIYIYHVNDILKFIEPQINTIFGFDEAYKRFTEYYQDRSDKQEWSNEYTKIFEGKNIIAIHMESMQSFMINERLEFNSKEVTPNLNKIADNSIYFSNFHPQVSLGTSSDTELTFNTSLMPTSIGIAFTSYYNRKYVAIPELLKEKGYKTFSMHGNNGSFWNRKIMHSNLGYDHMYDKSEYDINEIIGMGISDREFFKQSLEKLKEIYKTNQPFYGTLITLTNHTPFADTDKYGEYDVDIVDGDKTYPYMEGTDLGDYFKSVHYADKALGEFINALEKEGMLENTVILLYGDHDSRIDNNDYKKLYNYDKTTNTIKDPSDPTYIDIDYYKYELLRSTPFMIYSKETKESLKKVVDYPMGMYDVLPTIGNMFGFYSKYQLGHDIFDIKNKNIVVFPNGNFLTDTVYYSNKKEAYVILKDNSEITVDYINKNIEYTEKLLGASNSTIVFDLIRKQEDLINNKSEYIDERIKK